MKMTDALDWAAKYAKENKLFEPPMKANGYAVDGWAAPTAGERFVLLQSLADGLVKADATADAAAGLTLSEVAMLCSHGAVLCARCDFIPDSWRISSGN